MMFRPRRLGTPVVLAVALATFAGLAATSHGFPVQHVSVNNGGIWVTNNAPGVGTVAQFDKPIGQFDARVTPRSTSPKVNVWQDGSVVAVYDAAGARMYAVNVFQNIFSDGGQVISPITSGIALGGSTLAVLSTDHALRSATLGADGGSLAALSATAKPLAAHLAANAALAVGGNDTIWVAGGGNLLSFPEGASAPTKSSLPLPVSDPMQVATVGNVPVVADAANGELYLPDSKVPAIQIPGADTASGFELQQSSGPSDVVVAATDQALYSVNLSNGQVDRLSGGHTGTVAQPVQVAGCVYAAWANGSAGSYVSTCGSPPPATTAAQTFPIDDPPGAPPLVFRVNNDSVVLNDTTDGEVFLVGKTITGLKPRWQLATVPGQSSSQTQTTQEQQKNTLVANPVVQGVRPGTTTVVHVLDNARGNPDATIVVSGLGPSSSSGVTLAIAPDAQTVLATVTTLSTDAHFEYTISDGQGHTDSNEVTLVPHGPGQNAAPALRASYQPPPLKVASGGNLIIPILGEWRDADGDPLYIEASSVEASAGSAAVAADGELAFTAPQTSTDETVTVSYGVSDGRVSAPKMASLLISVLASAATTFVAPVTQPEAALAMAGSPITLHPLDIDLPGVDPTNHNARLTLAAQVKAPAGTSVATDLAAGTVTFAAQQAGDYYLAYTAAYGAAPTARGTIRVQVIPHSSTPMLPVTTPAVAVLHGQQPAVVDVLANDYDPQGWILGVTAATSADPGVRVAVIDQRWLRISADNPVPGRAVTVNYTVSDGRGSATGTVAVSAVAADQNADQITTTEAAVTVMAGDSADVPVLAGDSSSTGLALSIDGHPPTANPPVAGLLVGVQGGDIRIVAPAVVQAEEETTVSYFATDADGTTATGSIDVTVMPPPSKAHPDLAPQPQEVDARETAGDVAVIPIPVDGVDPDGDSVTVTSVTSAPTLGRIVAVGPDSISYQSYPGSLGTDTFDYQVTDPYGLTGTAQVRIAVLPAGLPQPPVAVDDVINAPPGASLHWNVLAGDFIAPGSKAVIEPLSKTNAKLPAGLRLAGPYVYLPVPASPSDPPVEFSYGLTVGSATSIAQVIVHAVAGAQLPPIASDVIAPQPAPHAATVTVNVLKNDDDPVGSPNDLKVSWAPAGVVSRGAELTIKLDPRPRQVPYQITAPDGLTATAVVYVPGSNAPVISLKRGARITLKARGSVTVPLSSVLTDSSGRQLKITTVNQLTASPAGNIAVSANQATAFQVTALGGFSGPGAITVQVYDGATLQDPTGQTATVTIPVQVGSDAPVLRCTTAPLQVVAGGAAQDWAIGQLCQLWVDTTAATAPAGYTVTWAKPVADVSASVPGGSGLQLTAANGVLPGTTGTLLVTPIGATVGAPLNVTIIKAPPPVGNPVSITVKAGQTATVDLGQYVTSPLARPHIAVLGVTRAAGLTAARSGATVTITAARDAAGTIGLVAMVTDAPGQADREISVPITVNVVAIGSGPGHKSGVPGAPGTPTVTASSQTIIVSFIDAAANGAPVEYYTAYTNGAPHRCVASPCTITGLANGASYTVYVTATNSFGEGAHSAAVSVRLNAVPAQVTGLSTGTGDGRVTLSWQPVGAPVTGYQVEISPPPSAGQQITSVGVVTSKTFTGLTNGVAYTFTVRAANAAGNGPWSLGVTATPFGKPATMAAPTATGAAVPDPATTRAITVSWALVQGSGSPVTGYTVHEYQAASNAGPWTDQVGTQTVNGATDSTSFTVNNNSSWYEYTVTATDQAGTSARSPLSTPPVQAVAPPDTPTAFTATATGQSDAIQLRFTAAPANAQQVSSIEYGINAATESGTIPGPFTPGTAYTETLTNAMNGGVVNGTPVTIYIAECNDAGLCSAWAGPSAQVTPYGPAAKPAVTAVANGTSVSYTWSVAGNGRAGVLQVSYSEPGGAVSNNSDDYGANGLNDGTTVADFGNGVTVTITATGPGGTATATAVTAAAVPPAPPTGLTATATGADNTIQFSFTAGAGNGAPITSIEYGINGAAETAAITAPFTAGNNYTETVTNAAIVDGAATTVYVAECNNVGLCSAWAGPSNQVTPGAGPLADPTFLEAGLSHANNQVEYVVQATGNGLPQTLNICADGTCFAVPEPAQTGTYQYGDGFTGNYHTTYTITVYVTDSIGQRAPATGTVDATVTTEGPPANVTVTAVNSGTCTPTSCAYSYQVTVTGFLPNTDLFYWCATPRADDTQVGPETDSTGSASFAGCGEATGGPAPAITITVSDNTNTAAGSYAP